MKDCKTFNYRQRFVLQGCLSAGSQEQRVIDPGELPGEHRTCPQWIEALGGSHQGGAELGVEFRHDRRRVHRLTVVGAQ